MWCLFLTKCKGQRAIWKGMGKKKKKYKNTKCIFGRARKIQKKYKSTRCIFSRIFVVFTLYFFVHFRIFAKQYKNKYESNISKIQNTKNKTNPKSRKYKIPKNNTNSKSPKYKIQKKYQFNIRKKGPTPYSFWKETTELQKNAKPTCCIFYTMQFWFCIVWVVFFLYMFFVLLNLGRRPFCSRRWLLKAIMNPLFTNSLNLWGNHG